MKLQVGLLGELLVEQKLAEMGWHPVRLDGRHTAPNTDLLAVRGQQRVSIQVKTTSGAGSHSHSDCYHFGNASAFLRRGIPFFNSKVSPLIADIVVGVNYTSRQSRFVVLPVALAEVLCRTHARYWTRVAKRDGGKRGDSFPIYLLIDGPKRAHADYHERVQRNLRPYENNWDILEVPAAKLHDKDAWPLLE